MNSCEECQISCPPFRPRIFPFNVIRHFPSIFRVMYAFLAEKSARLLSITAHLVRFH